MQYCLYIREIEIWYSCRLRNRSIILFYIRIPHAIVSWFFHGGFLTRKIFHLLFKGRFRLIIFIFKILTIDKVFSVKIVFVIFLFFHSLIIYRAVIKFYRCVLQVLNTVNTFESCILIETHRLFQISRQTTFTT